MSLCMPVLSFCSVSASAYSCGATITMTSSVLDAPLLPCSPVTVVTSPSSSSPCFFFLAPPLSFIPTLSLSRLCKRGDHGYPLGWEVIWMSRKLWMNEQPFLIWSAPPHLSGFLSSLLHLRYISYLMLPPLASFLLIPPVPPFSFIFPSSFFAYTQISSTAMRGLLLCRLSAIILLRRVHQVTGVCTCTVCRGDRMFLDAPGSGGL